jgi:outer membrane lipoprotein SlyB
MRKIIFLMVLALVAAAPIAFAQTQQTTPQQTYPQQQTQPPYNQPSQQTQPQTQPPYSQPPQQTQPQTQPPYDPSQAQPQVQPRTQQQADQQQQEVVSSNNPGEIPAGTDLYIRADENIKADKADPGRTYQGTVTRQVVTSDGRVLIPKGTPVQLAVMDNSATTGNKNLQLGVKSMTINGNTYPVTGAEASQTAGTTGSSKQGIGANKRTATHVGGGAALGTVLGAVLGGGKGAAIGAVSGAAAGGAVQVLTKGDKINVPAETEMQYHLEQPIRLQGYGSN